MKLKQRCAILCTALLCMALLLTACQPLRNSNFTGIWVCSKVVYDGQEVDAQALFADVSAPQLRLMADGSATLTMDSDVADGKWEEADGGVLFTDSAQSYQLAFADGMLAMDLGIMVCRFAKE